MSLNELNQSSIEMLALNRVIQTLDSSEHGQENSDDLVNLLKKLKPNPNPNPNDFPDFVMPDGYLEHFAVTSSEENRKGSEHIKRKKKFESESIEIKKSLSADQSYVKHELRYPEHSQGFLYKSLKKNINNHLSKLKNYENSKEIGIFLIEYNDDLALSMAEIITDESDERFGW